jgi:serine/threonine protein kinase
MPGPQVVGRYMLHGKIASGGMAAVHLGRLIGAVGFSRTVAIKRMHPHLTEDPEFVSMFLDEARLAARVRHPNVVGTLDIVAEGSELFLVMDYVQGETLARLLHASVKRGARVSVPIVAALASGILHGLHAAHEARDEQGQPLGIVHRDVSPQNVIVGVDGVPRVLDFGVAKAVGRLQTTREGQLKGKLSYMAPEQITGQEATRRTDVYAASVVFWEALAGRRLFRDDNEGAVLKRVLEGQIDAPSSQNPEVPAALDAIALRGLARNPEDRFATARDMANAIEGAVALAIPSLVGAWVEEMAPAAVAAQAAHLVEIDGSDQTVTRAMVRDETTAISQPSSLSVAASMRAPATPRARRLSLIGIAAVAVGALIAIAVFVSHRRVQAPAAAVPSTSAAALSTSPVPSD